MISAILRIVLEPLGRLWERRLDERKEVLNFAKDHYPELRSLLREVVTALQSNALRPPPGPQFDDDVMVVLYRVGRLCAWEKKFQREHGKVFRFISPTNMKLAQMLFDLGKEDLGMFSGRLNKESADLPTAAQDRLIALVRAGTSLDEFREAARTDDVFVSVRDCVTQAIRDGGGEWTKINFQVLARLLGQEMRAETLLPDERSYVDALMRTATIWIDEASLRSFDWPLRIKVFNPWHERIEFDPGDAQLRVCPADHPLCRVECGVAELSIVDSASGERKRRLEPGEQALAEWDRNASDGAPVPDGHYQIVYLPDSYDKKNLRTSAYGIDYGLWRDRAKQTWSMRHGSL